MGNHSSTDQRQSQGRVPTETPPHNRGTSRRPIFDIIAFAIQESQRTIKRCKRMVQMTMFSKGVLTETALKFTHHLPPRLPQRPGPTPPAGLRAPDPHQYPVLW